MIPPKPHILWIIEMMCARHWHSSGWEVFEIFRTRREAREGMKEMASRYYRLVRYVETR